MATIHHAIPISTIGKKEILIDYNPSMELRVNFQKGSDTVTMLTAPNMGVKIAVYGLADIVDMEGTSLGVLTVSNPIDVSSYKFFRIVCPKGSNGRCTFKISN